MEKLKGGATQNLGTQLTDLTTLSKAESEVC